MKQILLLMMMLTLMTGIVSAYEPCWEDVCSADSTGNYSLLIFQEDSGYSITSIYNYIEHPQISYNWLIDESNNVINASLTIFPIGETGTFTFGVGFVEAHFNGTNWTRNTSNKVILETKEIVVQPFTPFYVIQNDGVSPNITVPGHLSEYVNWCVFKDGETFHCRRGVWKVDYYEAPTQEPDPEPEPTTSGRGSVSSEPSKFLDQTTVTTQETTTQKTEKTFLGQWWSNFWGFLKGIFGGK